MAWTWRSDRRRSTWGSRLRRLSQRGSELGEVLDLRLVGLTDLFTSVGGSTQLLGGEVLEDEDVHEESGQGGRCAFATSLLLGAGLRKRQRKKKGAANTQGNR